METVIIKDASGIDPILPVEEPKKKKTFREYYQDPEFKAKHKARMHTRVKCACGTMFTLSNGTKHRRSKKHKALIALMGLTRGELQKLLQEKNEKTLTDLSEILELVKTTVNKELKTNIKV